MEIREAFSFSDFFFPTSLWLGFFFFCLFAVLFFLNNEIIFTPQTGESNKEILNVRLSLNEFLKLLLFLIISSLWNPGLLTYSVCSGVTVTQ